MRSIWSADNPVDVLKEHLLVLVGCFVPANVIRVGNKDEPWFDDKSRHILASSRRLIIGEPVIALEWTVKCLSAVK